VTASVGSAGMPGLFGLLLLVAAVAWLRTAP
jgi:MYXO-CTERM domain-containing protein